MSMTSAAPKPRAGEHVEPWRVGQPRDSSGVRFIEEGGHATIGKIYDEVDARRIVACVNACEGFTDEQLAREPGMVRNNITLRERERELVEALNGCVLALRPIEESDPSARNPATLALKQARAAIAKHGR